MNQEQEALESPDFTQDDLTQEDLEQQDLSQLDFDLQYFKRLYKLTVNQMAVLVREADRFQGLIASAKTTPKRNLYTKKFSKTRAQFQDELARLMQIKHILDENNVDLEELEDEE